MKHARWAELKLLLNDRISAGIIIKAWSIHNIQTRTEWIRFDKLTEGIMECCNKLGWDPDTTLVLYEMPKDNPNGDPVSDEVFDREVGGLTLGNHTTCICCFYKDMTLQKLATAMNQIDNMKAFL